MVLAALNVSARCCLLALLLAGSAMASPVPPSGWLQQLAAVEHLIKVDTLAAYEALQQLQSTAPETLGALERVQLLNLQARLDSALGNSTEAERRALEAAQLARQYQYRLGEVRAQLNLVRISINLGKIDQSVAAAAAAMALVRDTDEPMLRTEAMFWLSMAYRRIGQVSESVNLALQALDIARHSEDPMALVYAHHGLALSFDQSGRPEEAQVHYRAMHQAALQADSRIHQAVGLQGQAMAISRSGDFASAEALAREAVAIHRSLNAPQGLGVGLFALADLLLRQSRHAEAIALLDEVIDLYRRHPNQLGLWFALNARSDSYQQLNDLVSAEQDALAAQVIAGAIDQRRYRIESARKLAGLAAVRGDYVSAYELLYAADTLEGQDALEKSREEMVDLVERYRLSAKQREIDELNRHNELQAMEITQRTLQQRWLLTSLLSLLLLLLGTGYYLYRFRRYNLLLRGLASRLETVREEERRRIARDLHDDLGQYLTTMRLEVSGMRLLATPASEPVQERLQGLSKLIDSTLRVVRDIAASLRPAALDMGGVSALEWLTEEFTRRTGVPCNLDVDTDGLDLNDQQLTTVFRIVQESLTNISRHAQASRVSVSIYRLARILVLEIVDNGIGFEMSAVKKSSYGLTGMRERVLMLNGDIQVLSKPGQGTTITVRIPIVEQEQADD